MTEDLASLHCAAPASTSEGLHEYDGRDIDWPRKIMRVENSGPENDGSSNQGSRERTKK